MRKIGLLSLALVLALGALGVGYAAWTDQVTIEGTVNTGSVDLNVVDYSGTWVYKMYPHDYNYIHCWVGQQPLISREDGELVAWAKARAGVDDVDKADIVVEFENIFPCQPFMADFLLHYNGSVPARIYAEITGTSGDADILAQYVSFVAYKLEGYTHGEDDIHEWLIPANMVDIGVQVHECDHILVAMVIQLPQDNTLMDLEGSFTATITAIQWNKYDEYYGNGNGSEPV